MKTKKVECSVCGKKGIVKIVNDGKILSKNFFYFGKINMNFKKTDKYYYEVLFDKDGFTKKTKSGMIATKRLTNKDYDKNAKPKYIEYWECKSCFIKGDSK